MTHWFFSITSAKRLVLPKHPDQNPEEVFFDCFKLPAVASSECIIYLIIRLMRLSIFLSSPCQKYNRIMLRWFIRTYQVLSKPFCLTGSIRFYVSNFFRYKHPMWVKTTIKNTSLKNIKQKSPAKAEIEVRSKRRWPLIGKQGQQRLKIKSGQRSHKAAQPLKQVWAWYQYWLLRLKGWKFKFKEGKSHAKHVFFYTFGAKR